MFVNQAGVSGFPVEMMKEQPEIVVKKVKMQER